MSGHSKWSQIKRQKGVADIKRGQAFTKVAKTIALAVKEGAGVTDPNQNFKLRLAMEKAKAINMPKDNIERAITRGIGKSGKGEEFEEVVYEGFAPLGVAIIVEAVTDNKLRTTSEVKNAIEKNGGTLATPGAVSYLFEQKGLITVRKNGKTLDEVFEKAADFGAEDVEEVLENVLIYTKSEDLSKVGKRLIESGLEILESELTRRPVVVVSIKNKEEAAKILSFMEKVEDLDDVQKIFANFDIEDNLIS